MSSRHGAYLTVPTHHKAARIPGPEFTLRHPRRPVRGDVGGLSKRRCSSGSRVHSAALGLRRLAPAQDGRQPWLSGLSLDNGDDDVDGHSSLGHQQHADWRACRGQLGCGWRFGMAARRVLGGDVSAAPRTGESGLLECLHPGRRRCRPLITALRDHGIQAALESSATHGFARSPKADIEIRVHSAEPGSVSRLCEPWSLDRGSARAVCPTMRRHFWRGPRRWAARG